MPPHRVAFTTGLLLLGYGALILLELLAHEDARVGAALALAGAAVVAWSVRGGARDSRAPGDAAPRSARASIVAALGATAAGGVLAYNALTASTLSLPEWGILAYGVALVAASRFVHDARVEAAVAWSFPLLAAPFGLYALDAALDAAQGSSPLDGFIRHALVAPMTLTLTLLGFDAVTHGQTVMLGTPRGSLALTVGVVCAGFQPGVLFLGVLALHAWRERTPPKRFAALLGLGLAGVYVVNVIRLVVLALVGHQWGGAALQTAHAHGGWVLFVLWMIAFWALVARYTERAPARDVNV